MVKSLLIQTAHDLLRSNQPHRYNLYLIRIPNGMRGLKSFSFADLTAFLIMWVGIFWKRDNFANWFNYLVFALQKPL